MSTKLAAIDDDAEELNSPDPSQAQAVPKFDWTIDGVEIGRPYVEGEDDKKKPFSWTIDGVEIGRPYRATEHEKLKAGLKQGGRMAGQAALGAADMSTLAAGAPLSAIKGATSASVPFMAKYGTFMDDLDEIYPNYSIGAADDPELFTKLTDDDREKIVEKQEDFVKSIESIPTTVSSLAELAFPSVKSKTESDELARTFGGLLSIGGTGKTLAEKAFAKVGSATAGTIVSSKGAELAKKMGASDATAKVVGDVMGIATTASLSGVMSKLAPSGVRAMRGLTEEMMTSTSKELERIYATPAGKLLTKFQDPVKKAAKQETEALLKGVEDRAVRKMISEVRHDALSGLSTEQAMYNKAMKSIGDANIGVVAPKALGEGVKTAVKTVNDSLLKESNKLYGSLEKYGGELVDTTALKYGAKDLLHELESMVAPGTEAREATKVLKNIIKKVDSGRDLFASEALAMRKQINALRSYDAGLSKLPVGKHLENVSNLITESMRDIGSGNLYSKLKIADQHFAKWQSAATNMEKVFKGDPEAIAKAASKSSGIKKLKEFAEVSPAAKKQVDAIAAAQAKKMLFPGVFPKNAAAKNPSVVFKKAYDNALKPDVAEYLVEALGAESAAETTESLRVLAEVNDILLEKARQLASIRAGSSRVASILARVIHNKKVLHAGLPPLVGLGEAMHIYKGIKDLAHAVQEDELY